MNFIAFLAGVCFSNLTVCGYVQVPSKSSSVYIVVACIAWWERLEMHEIVLPKVFDRTWLNSLAYKLLYMSVKEDLYCWLESFLYNRKEHFTKIWQWKISFIIPHLQTSSIIVSATRRRRGIKILLCLSAPV